MLDVFGIDLAAGYDVGCYLETTLNNSPLGVLARKMNHRCLVGAFHGHAHNRLCQSRFLATYVEGLGLEDLEGCERFFAKSNALASGTRYSSTFHRRQAISEYALFTDRFETYANLSSYLSSFIYCSFFELSSSQVPSLSTTTNKLFPFSKRNPLLLLPSQRSGLLVVKLYRSGYRKRRCTFMDYQRNLLTKPWRWSTTRCLKAFGSLSEL